MDAVLQGDAFALPFRDGAFDVVLADPPYDVTRLAGKRLRRQSLRETGYIEFVSRGWWHEAWRVLGPDGHLYVWAPIKELSGWYTEAPAPQDVIAWWQPNAAGVQNKIRHTIGGRNIVWRPILHWRRGRAIRWRRGEFVESNHFTENQVQSNMKEAQAWPNQLPVRLLTWLLRPHREARVLDLFSGSGSAREAALGLGVSVVSVDRSPEAVVLTRRRQAQYHLPSACAGASEQDELGLDGAACS